jgi:hypothetical protein
MFDQDCAGIHHIVMWRRSPEFIFNLTSHRFFKNIIYWLNYTFALIIFFLCCCPCTIHVNWSTILLYAHTESSKYVCFIIVFGRMLELIPMYARCTHIMLFFATLPLLIISWNEGADLLPFIYIIYYLFNDTLSLYVTQS